MPSYELVYFNGRGKAELSRLLFHQAGVEFKDTRIEREDWPAHKPESPTGQVPYLKIDDFKLPQSSAIARYLAREFDLYGTSNMEKAKIDVVLDTLDDFVTLCVKVRYAADDTAREGAKKTLMERAPVFVNLLVKMLTDNEGDYIVGSKVSVADFALMHYLTQFSGMENLTDLKPITDETNLETHRSKIAELPKICDYLANRPQTAF